MSRTAERRPPCGVRGLASSYRRFMGVAGRMEAHTQCDDLP
jgi:hypothetical protein